MHVNVYGDRPLLPPVLARLRGMWKLGWSVEDISPETWEQLQKKHGTISRKRLLMLLSSSAPGGEAAGDEAAAPAVEAEASGETQVCWLPGVSS